MFVFAVSLSTKHYIALMPEEEHDIRHTEQFVTGDLWVGFFLVVKEAIGRAFHPV